MKEVIEFFVVGTPRPAGSKQGFAIKKAGNYTGKVAMVDSAGQKGKDWRSDVKRAGIDAHKTASLRCPMTLEVEFIMPRPKKHFRTGKFANDLREDAPHWHTQAPDRTKVLRSLEDALKGVVWVDDAQVIGGNVTKRWADHNERSGARVKITIVHEEGFLTT